MNKKILIGVIVVILVVLVAVVVLMGMNNNVSEIPNTNDTTSSGELNNEVSGDVDEKESGESSNIKVISNGYPSFVGIENLDVFLDEQVVPLEEIPEKNYMWTYKIDNPEMIEVNSDEIEETSSEWGVGTRSTRYYKLKGLKEGNTVITFYNSYLKNGENFDHQEVSYELEVNSDLKIALRTEIREIYK